MTAFNGFGPIQLADLGKILAAEKSGLSLRGPMNARLGQLSKIGRGGAGIKWGWWLLGAAIVGVVIFLLYSENKKKKALEPTLVLA